MVKSYLEMKKLESDFHNAKTNSHPPADVELLSKRLDDFEIKVNKLKVPAVEMEEYFKLKSHINAIRNRIQLYCKK